MASDAIKLGASVDDGSSDSGSTESSPIPSDVEFPVTDKESSAELRFFKQRKEIAWRWTWLKLQSADLRRQDKKCDETLARLRQQKGTLKPLPLPTPDETHALRSTGITPLKHNRKLAKKPPEVGQIRNPFQEAAAHQLFSLKPPVTKKPVEKKSVLATTSQSMTAPSPVDIADQSSEAQLSASTDHALATAGDDEEDFYGGMYSDEGSDDGRPRNKRALKLNEDDTTTPKRKMSRSVDFELPDAKNLSASASATSGGRSRRHLRASDWDMNNIVVPLSISSPRALTIVKPKEIVTPGWKQQKSEFKGTEKDREKEREKEKERTEKEQQVQLPPPPPPDDEKGEVRLLEEIEPALQNHAREGGVPSSSEENTADELYAARHAPHEKAERARWETPALLQMKKLAEAGAAGGAEHDSFLVTGEFDQMESGAGGGKASRESLVHLEKSTRRKRHPHVPAEVGGGDRVSASAGGGGGGGGGAGGRRRPSRAGLYWMRSRFYADLRWEVVHREGQADTVLVFKHLDGPIPHRDERHPMMETIVEEDDEVEVTIRHRNPLPLPQEREVVPAPEPDPALAEAPYSPTIADVTGLGRSDALTMSLSLASSAGDSLMAETVEPDLEMHEAQVENDLQEEGDVDVEGADAEDVSMLRPEVRSGKEEPSEDEEAGASPRERSWAVRSLLNASDSDSGVKSRAGSAVPSTAPAATTAAAITLTTSEIVTATTAPMAEATTMEAHNGTPARATE